jgi:hypothetical protein
MAIGEAEGLQERLQDYWRGCMTIGEAEGLKERLQDYRRG